MRLMEVDEAANHIRDLANARGILERAGRFDQRHDILGAQAGRQMGRQAGRAAKRGLAERRPKPHRHRTRKDRPPACHVRRIAPRGQFANRVFRFPCLLCGPMLACMMRKGILACPERLAVRGRTTS